MNKEKAKKQEVRWTYEGNSVSAFTKSEARAKFKRQLGLKRLPVGAHVTKE